MQLDLLYDVSPDASRFLVVKEADVEKNKLRTVTLVRNWFAEFQGKEKQ
ncbi:MAG: hypothetical protein JJE04_12900 [Acidobacteriia bacterium]|nr:hypothetical protein [Terriglobia bacterium]